MINVAPSWTIYYNCVTGSPSRASDTVTGPTASYTVPDQNWYPTGDQSSSLSYENQTFTVPNVCNGGTVRLNQGVKFTAILS